MEPVKRRRMPEKGLAHVFAAARYSIAGARVLWGEEAVRLECIMLVVFTALFWLTGAGLVYHLIHAGIFLAVVCVEAINTAIENIVDRTSPEISEYGKHVKDLGSFSVACMLILYCGYVAYVLLGTFF